MATLHYRFCDCSDAPLLGALNEQLIQDERHRNPMTGEELVERMQDWIGNGYRAILFSDAADPVLAYALYSEGDDEVYLRHFYVVRHRRREGVGQRALRHLREDVWTPGARLTVAVLCHNEGAVRFWESVGYRPYAFTMEMTN